MGRNRKPAREMGEGMTPYWDCAGSTFYHGDVREVLRALPEQSVQTCVTSPPYWGLRDYGTATWEGGDDGCAHTKDRTVGVASSGLEGGKGTTNHQQEASYREQCGKCGAVRIDQQLGLEPTPEAYVAKMVDVFREVRRAIGIDLSAEYLDLAKKRVGSQSSLF